MNNSKLKIQYLLVYRVFGIALIYRMFVNGAQPEDRRPYVSLL